MSWFESDSLRLRPAEPSDADALLAYVNLPDVYDDRQLGGRTPFPLTSGDVSERLEEDPKTGRVLMIEAEDTVVGHASIDWWWDAFQPWLGIVIAPTHRRNGHGRQAADMILDYYFLETPAHVVTADVVEWNDGGQAFVRALGFKEAGRYRREVRRDGKWHDLLTFDLLRREWEALRAD